MLILVLAVGLCGLLMITFSLPLLHPPTRLVDVGAPGDAYVALSFYRPEQAGGTSFRWSGPYSALALPAWAGRLIVRMRPHSATNGQSLDLISADGPISLQPLTGDWRTYHVLVASGATNPIHLYADLVQPGEDDPRELGVALDWVRLTPIGDAQAGVAQALGEAAKLVWALALLGAARFSMPFVVPARTAPLRR